MSTDYDCWREATEDVTVEMVMNTMKANAVNARRFVSAVLDSLALDTHADTVNAKHLEGSVKHGISTPISQWSDDVKARMEWLFPGYFNV